jgi:hypothetical protein
MKTKYFALAIAILVTSGYAANAGFVTQADFVNAQTTDLNNIGISSPSNVAAPLTVGIYTFTTDDGQLRYAPIGLTNSNSISDNTDLGFINIAIAPEAGVYKFGFFVGLGSDAQHHSETVSFFDGSNALLGSINVSQNGGFAFVGFENPTGLIGRALITDTDLNSTVYERSRAHCRGGISRSFGLCDKCLYDVASQET